MSMCYNGNVTINEGDFQMECKQIVFTEKNKAELLTVDVNEPAPNEVMVETVVSTISCGTERANITGDPNVNAYGASGVVFPRMSGYNSAGIVVKKGSNVKSVEIGDRVVVFWGLHKKYNVVSEENVVKIEDAGISFETGALSFISTFPMAAIRKTRLEMGESAIVMGLGILGMIAVKLLRACGAVPIIVADPNPKRREIALKNGADYAFDPLGEGFADPMVMRWPFEKVLSMHQKATLIRVHPLLYQIPAELNGRGIGVKQDCISFVREIKEKQE